MGDSSLPKLTCGRLATTALPGGGSFAFACAAGMPPPDELDSQVYTVPLLLPLIFLHWYVLQVQALPCATAPQTFHQGAVVGTNNNCYIYLWCVVSKV